MSWPLSPDLPHYLPEPRLLQTPELFRLFRRLLFVDLAQMLLVSSR